MINLEIITRNSVKNLSFNNFKNNQKIEYDYSKRCSICGNPYVKNYLLPQEMINILGDKIKYIPSCKCHENFCERKIEELTVKAEKERLLNKGYKYKNFSVINSKFLNSTFENAQITENLSICKKYAEAFLKKEANVGLILYGNSGTGKTFDSACIANYLMKNGKSVIALNLGLYLSRIRLEWSNMEFDVLDKVSQCDLLIIDDFGAEKITDWVLEKIFLLIDTRYKSEKPIIISTNLTYKENSPCDISRVFGSRIKDRIKEMCYGLCYLGESKRREAISKFKNLIL